MKLFIVLIPPSSCYFVLIPDIFLIQRADMILLYFVCF